LVNGLSEYFAEAKAASLRGLIIIEPLARSGAAIAPPIKKKARIAAGLLVLKHVLRALPATTAAAAATAAAAIATATAATAAIATATAATAAAWTILSLVNTKRTTTHAITV
jgi:hypothetical protein